MFNYRDIKEKVTKAGKSTKVMDTPSSKASTASQAAEVKTPFKVTPLRLKPADPTNCITSDNMADCCKTLCKVLTVYFVRNLKVSNVRCVERLSA